MRRDWLLHWAVCCAFRLAQAHKARRAISQHSCSARPHDRGMRSCNHHDVVTRCGRRRAETLLSGGKYGGRMLVVATMCRRRHAFVAAFSVRASSSGLAAAREVDAGTRQQSNSLAPSRWAAAGDQPQAIERITGALKRGDPVTLLRGATGTGERSGWPFLFHEKSNASCMSLRSPVMLPIHIMPISSDRQDVRHGRSHKPTGRASDSDPLSEQDARRPAHAGAVRAYAELGSGALCFSFRCLRPRGVPRGLEYVYPQDERYQRAAGGHATQSHPGALQSSDTTSPDPGARGRSIRSGLHHNDHTDFVPHHQHHLSLGVAHAAIATQSDLGPTMLLLASSPARASSSGVES